METFQLAASDIYHVMSPKLRLIADTLLTTVLCGLILYALKLRRDGQREREAKHD
jgi:hypothetical protein